MLGLWESTNPWQQCEPLDTYFDLSIPQIHLSGACYDCVVGVKYHFGRTTRSFSQCLHLINSELTRINKFDIFHFKWSTKFKLTWRIQNELISYQQQHFDGKTMYFALCETTIRRDYLLKIEKTYSWFPCLKTWSRFSYKMHHSNNTYLLISHLLWYYECIFT